jgi:hypothetical protein
MEPCFSADDVVKVLRKLAGHNRVSDSLFIRERCSEIRQLIPLWMSPHISLKFQKSSGLGLFAERDLQAGTLILVDHPASSVLDCESGASEFSDQDGFDTIALIDQLGQKWTPEVEECLRSLYPIRYGSPDPDAIGISLPGKILAKLNEKLLSVGISLERLVKAVQLNSLGFYSFPELCSFNEQFRFLTGTGLYRNASMFNHSCDPNVNHYSVGDVSLFRLTRHAKSGEELCISYIGSDLLCEAKSVRYEFLSNRDFECACAKCNESNEGEDPWVEELDLETRVSLHMACSSRQRCTMIRRLLISHRYIRKDRIELVFMLAREDPEGAKNEWAELLDHADRCRDFLAVVIWMHYMVRHGYSEDITAKMMKTAFLSLGPELSEPKSLNSLFSITDFPVDSPLRSQFEKLCNRLERF